MSDWKANELQHRSSIVRRNLSAIPEGARVAYCDASAKDGLVRSAVVVANGYPEVEVTTELVIDPKSSDVNDGELAAIIAAAAFSPDYIVSDSLTSINKLDKGMYEGIPVLFVPGKTGLVPGHDLAHDLAQAARKAVEES
jgi:hypothetical protein